MLIAGGIVLWRTGRRMNIKRRLTRRHYERKLNRRDILMVRIRRINGRNLNKNEEGAAS